MLSHIPPKLHSALIDEISQWRQDQIISEETAAILTARYPISSSRSGFITVISILGAILLGLGVLLYVSANWHGLSAAVKLSILVSSILLSHYAGWRFRYEPGDRPKLGTAFFLLGSILYGASIWLVSQIFNLDLSFESGAFLWALGSVGSALINRSSALAALSSIVLGFWSISSSWSLIDTMFDGSWHPDLGLRFAGAVTVSLLLAGYTRSRTTAWISLILGAIWSATISGASTLGLLCYGIALFAGYLFVRKNFQLFSAPFMYVGVVSTFSAMLALTFGQGSTYGYISSVPNYAGLLAMAVASLGSVIVLLPKFRAEAASAAAIMLLCLITKAIGNDTIRLLFVNGLLIASMCAVTLAGSSKLNSKGLVNVSLVFLVLDIICRYFDFFFSMMNRSTFFMVGGAVLMVAAALAEKSRRRLLEGFQS